MRINLLPKEERPLKQTQVRWEFLVGLAGFLTLAVVLIFIWAETARWQSLSVVYQEALAREERLQRQVQSVAALRQTVEGLQAELGVYQTLLADPNPAFAALPVLSRHSFGSLWIERLAAGANGISVAGYTRDVTALSSYLSYLQGYSQDAEVTQVVPLDGTDFQVFAIELKGVQSNAALELD